MTSSNGGSLNSWDGVCGIARNAGAKFPELVAAQWALESDWGKSAPGHNYFGLKGDGQMLQTEEVIDGRRVVLKDGFLQFPALGECVTYLVDHWYRDWNTYKGVNRAVSAEAAAEELFKQGYATDPEYAAKLKKLMRGNKQSQSKSQESSEPPVLLRLEALRETWLKKEAKPADDLGEKQKVRVSQGKVYAVSAYTESAADAHAQVALAGGAGTWFVYEPHWRKLQDAKVQPTSGAVDWSDFNCLVTPNLTVGEMLQWDRRRMPAANSAVRARLLRTAAEFQNVRNCWGRSLGVTSFYRPEPINGQVGGVPGSRHVSGEAFDLYPTDRTLESFYQWIRVRWTGGLGDGRNRGFVHLDIRGGGGFVPGAGVRPAAEWLY
jgi:uncharacterized protein YcbK (DUF882 family)